MHRHVLQKLWLPWIISFEFWAVFAPTFVHFVNVTVSLFMRTWFVSATCSVGVLVVCCLCSLSLFHVRVPRVPFTGLQKYVPRFAFHIAVLGRSLLWLCAVAVVYPVKTVVQTKRPIYAIKQWLGSIMEGLLII